MRSLQIRTPARSRVAPPASPPDASARLELLEFFLAHHEDLARCAQASLEWLGRQAGVRQAVCVTLEGDASELVGLAGTGVPHEAVEQFSWPLLEMSDPLVAALSSRSPVVFKPARANGHAARVPPPTPLGNVPFTAIPLGGAR